MAVEVHRLSRTPGTHTVVLKVDLRYYGGDEGLHHLISYETEADVSKETAIAQAAAKVSKDLRLPHPGYVEFVSYNFVADE